MPIYINGYLVAGNHFVKQEQLHLDKSRKYILVTKRIQISNIYITFSEVYLGYPIN